MKHYQQQQLVNTIYKTYKYYYINNFTPFKIISQFYILTDRHLVNTVYRVEKISATLEK